MLHGIGWVDAASFPDQSYRVEDKKKTNIILHYFGYSLKIALLQPPKGHRLLLKKQQKKPLILIIFSLQIFFEGVQECIAAGVKEDEVGYQLAFSKQELRKNIKEYPAKDIKKGLELLYKKVEKHLCEEENLLQVKW